jgi:hypothetical protein
MEADAHIEYPHQALAQRREHALAVIAKYRTPSGAAVIPVWIALFVAVLLACVPSSRANPIPYIVGMLAFAVVWLQVVALRHGRRLDAVLQLILQGETHSVTKT